MEHDEEKTLLEQWWRDWRAEDFSWSGLEHKECGPIDDFDDEGTIFSLQDYWLRDVSSGEPRAQDELIRSGELVRAPDDTLWHIVHLPLRWSDGTPTEKARWGDEKRRQFTDILKRRLEVASKFTGGDADPWGQAFLDGLILHPGDPATWLKGITINASFNWAYLPRFVSGTYAARASFRNCCFWDSANFSSAVFMGSVSFHNARFLGGTYEITDFVDEYSESGHDEAHSAYFEHVEFHDEADFDKAIFTQASFLHDAKFRRIAHFDRVAFHEGVSFERSAFEFGATFTAAKFGGAAIFTACKFGARAENWSAHDLSRLEETLREPRQVRFDGAKFDGLANLERTEFLVPTFWNGMQCDVRATFHAAVFNAPVTMRKAIFRRGADFDACAFADVLVAEDCKFEGLADFSGSSATRASVSTAVVRDSFESTNFRRTEFCAEADFTNRRFRSAADFSYATFRRVALFHGGSLHQGTSFVGTTFGISPASWSQDLEPTWVEVPGEERKRQRNEGYARLEHAFRTLKLLMENIRARNEEQRFYRLELQVRQMRGDISLLERVPSAIYGFASDHGNSFVRPAMALLVLWLSGAVGYWLWSLCLSGHLGAPFEMSLDKPLDQSLFDAGGLSGRILFRPFAIWSGDFAARGWETAFLDGHGKGYGLLIRWVATIQSLLGVLLAFLVALALRRRFQIN